MKLEDADSESVRQKMRQTHLDDLEDAFKDEGPLNDSSETEQTDSDVYIPPGAKKVGGKSDNNENKQVAATGEEPTSKGLTADDIFGPDENSDDTLPYPEQEDFVPFPKKMENLPYPQAGSNNTFNPNSIEGRRNSQISFTGRSTNYRGNYWNSQQYRRYYIVCGIIFFAIVGLVLAILIGGGPVVVDPKNNSTRTNEPDDTSAWGVTFARGVDLINDSGVSSPFKLSRKCKHPLCGGNGNYAGLDVRDMVMYYLVFGDYTFKTLAMNQNFENDEYAIQRYILTLFAFETGLEKSPDGVWLVNDWKESARWLDGNDHCEWFGVTCTDREAFVYAKDFAQFMSTSQSSGQKKTHAMVTAISLNQNGLEGSLRKEVYSLRHLQYLELWQALLTGELSRDIRNLPDLKRLWLHETGNLVGSIPEELGLLTNLESVFLGGNQLEGPLPPIHNLKKLNTLALHGNNMNGEIPGSYMHLQNLERLFLDQNNFNGKLPIGLALLPKMRDFRLNDNEFTGSIPVQYGALRNLEVFYVSNNDLTGELSDALVLDWTKMSKYRICKS